MRYGSCYSLVSATAVIFTLKTKILIHGSLNGKEGCSSCDRTVRFSVRISSIICVYKKYTVIAKTAAYVVRHQGIDRKPDLSHVNLIKFG
jgi:hypothetical protein